MNTEANNRERAIAMVLLETTIANRELQDTNRRLRRVLDRIASCDVSTVPREGNSALLHAIADAYSLLARIEGNVFPLDTCTGCGGPRGADGFFRHTTPDCPVIGVRASGT